MAMNSARGPFGLPIPSDTVPRKILIVEDHSEARQMLSLALRKLGFEVWTTGSGAAALVTVREKKPAVVVLDIGLEDGQSGLQVCEKIKSSKNGVAPYVVITSGRHDKDTVDEAKLRGANAYLVKPFRLSRLLEIVSAAHTAPSPFIVEMAA